VFDLCLKLWMLKSGFQCWLKVVLWEFLSCLVWNHYAVVLSLQPSFSVRVCLVSELSGSVLHGVGWIKLKATSGALLN